MPPEAGAHEPLPNPSPPAQPPPGCSRSSAASLWRIARLTTVESRSYSLKNLEAAIRSARELARSTGFGIGEEKRCVRRCEGVIARRL